MAAGLLYLIFFQKAQVHLCTLLYIFISTATFMTILKHKQDTGKFGIN